MANTIGTGDKTDYDETRRLLYMALLVPRTKKYNLAGTLVNALVHHHAVGLDANEVADHVVGYLNATDAPTLQQKAHGDWLNSQINRITAELGD